MQSILHKASAAAICPEPFPHLVIHDALDAEVYAALARSFPVDEIRRAGKELAKKGKFGYSAAGLLSNPRIDAVWRAFVAHHVSAAFFRDVLAVFGETIRALHPGLEARLGKPLDALETSIRFHEPLKEVALECQLIYNPPAPERYEILGPHLDREVALYAGLLYFRREEDRAEGGDLELYRYASGRPVLPEGSRRVPPRYAEPVRRVQYAPNTLVFFPHSAYALHGVTERAPAAWPRLHLNFVAEFPQKIYDLTPFQTLAVQES